MKEIRLSEIFDDWIASIKLVKWSNIDLRLIDGYVEQNNEFLIELKIFLRNFSKWLSVEKKKLFIATEVSKVNK